jgi:outer membrane murein-binding lipoprotein Lpp
MIEIPIWMIGITGVAFATLLGVSGWALKAYLDRLTADVKELRTAVTSLQVLVARLADRLSLTHLEGDQNNGRLTSNR